MPVGRRVADAVIGPKRFEELPPDGERKVVSLDRKCLGGRNIGDEENLRAEALSIRRLAGSRWRVKADALPMELVPISL